MPASGISSELSAHQMAPAGAISGHGNDYAPLGNGVLLLSFLVLVYRSSTSRFEVCVLQKLSTREQLRFGLGYFHGFSGFFCLHVFTEFAFIDTWNFAKAPSSLRGAEGRWRCRRLLVAFSGSLQQTLSLCPCAATVVQRAPSHNRWGVSETTLPAKTQGRTLDCPFNLLPPRVAGWLLMCRCKVCNRAAVALVATGPRRGAL